MFSGLGASRSPYWPIPAAGPSGFLPESRGVAIDPGPTTIRLKKGESALTAVSWSNTVEIGEDKAAGTYLSIARRAHDKPVVWPVVTDIGTTAKIALTAWCLRFPT